jgi:hypothetical protein
MILSDIQLLYMGTLTYWDAAIAGSEIPGVPPKFLFPISFIVGLIVTWFIIRNDFVTYLKSSPFNTILYWSLTSAVIGFPVLILSPFLIIGFSIYYSIVHIKQWLKRKGE